MCSSLSLTDADARLMKNKNGFAVAYESTVTAWRFHATHLVKGF
ncbi:MAG: hypothetical protein ACLU3F_09945 [Blautia wexlerae]